MKKNVILFLLTIPFSLFSQTQIGNDIDGEAADDRSGWTTSISDDGTIVAIGAYKNDGDSFFTYYDSGHVRVFENIDNTWTQIGNDIDGANPGANFGQKISLSNDGNILAIGAENQDSVYIYQNINNEWVQIGSTIVGDDSYDNFGRSLDLSGDGNILAVGAHQGFKQTGDRPGYVKVYEFQNNEWTQIGSNIEGEADEDRSGYAVSLSDDGSIVAIGAYKNQGINGEESGHVRVYKNTNNSWTQVGSDIDGEAEDDLSGIVVELSSNGNILAIGGMNNDGVNGEGSGHVRLYQNINDSWSQIGDDIDGEAQDDWSGYDISLSDDGSLIAIGGRFNDGGSNQSLTNSGHVRIYQNTENNWIQLGDDIDGENTSDSSGSGQGLSLSADGTTLAIGASGNDGNGDGSGHVRVFDISTLIDNNDLSTDEVFNSKHNINLNITSHQLTIDINDGSQLKQSLIYDSIGQLIFVEKNDTIDISSLANGVYLIKIITDNGETINKFMVN